jgi:catechol-2,3-dioxygenase
MNFVQIKETCLYVHNLDQIRNFYHEVLELPIIMEDPGKHIFFRVGSSVLLFFNPDDSRTKVSPPGHYGGGKQHVALEVPTSEYLYTKNNLVKKGIKIIDSVKWKNGIESFYFEDPEGNVVEIVPDKGMWD